MPDSRSIAQESFLAYLSEIEVEAQNAARLGDFRAAVMPWIDWGNIDPESKRTVVAFQKADLNASRTFQSLFVTAQAGFEQFIREIINEAAYSITSKKVSYDNLLKRFGTLADHHVVASGKALSTFFEPKEHYKFIFTDIANNVCTSFSGSQGVTINGPVMSYRVGNIDSAAIDSILGRFNYLVKWDEFAKNQSLRDIFQTKGQRDTETAIKHHIDESLALRNRLAHSQGAASDATKERLGRLINFYKEFAPLLNESFRSFVDFE
ncbi:HEPN domain-containing protein [Burkholderia gladioli]|uniref:HEPN domain-containing protein n=1 Tax=Burkholderia gladioli TaxID=28095 RepID=UPI0016409E10|nr:HEPN domain-containing protein [Burkholderia gladioli]